MSFSKIASTLLLFCILLMGCRKNFSTVKELNDYLNSTAYKHSSIFKRNGIIMEVKYLPSEAVMYSQLKQYENKVVQLHQNKELNTTEKQNKLNKLRNNLQSNLEIYENSVYFKLTIGFEDEAKDIVYEKLKMDFDNYSKWIHKLLGGLKQYISLSTVTTGEIPLSLYHFDRTFGLTKKRSMLLSFPKKFNGAEITDKTNKSVKLKIKEFGLRIGDQAFEFDLPLDEIDYNFDISDYKRNKDQNNEK